MANLCALAFIPKVLVVVSETEIRIRVLNELYRNISGADFTFPTLEAAVTSALALGFRVLVSDTISDR